MFKPSVSDLNKSPKTFLESPLPRRKRSSICLGKVEGGLTSDNMDGSMKMCVVERAVLLKSQLVSIEYEILACE